MGQRCSIFGCNKSVLARGWCSSHYERWRAHGDPTAGAPVRKKVQAEAVSFLESIASYTGDDCIQWPFHRFDNGYPKLNKNGSSLVASRVLCEKVHGLPPSPQHEAAHSCGNGHLACINPNHVRWLLPRENQMERVDHGTSNRGARHGLSKLDDQSVLDICDRLQRREPQAMIANRHGVSQTAISEIATGKTWSWLTGRVP